MPEMHTLVLNGQAYTVTDPNAARVDNTSVGDGVWSAKHIVDTLCPPFSREGEIIKCSPVEGYPLEVVTCIPESAPVTGLTLHCTGKNLWDFKSGLSQCRGISASSGADVIRYGYIVKLPPGTYTISGEVLAGTNYLYFNPINLNTLVMGALNYFITSTGATTAKVTLQEGQGLYFYNANSAATQAVSETVFYNNVNIQIEAGNTKTDYEPYQGKVRTVTLPAPVSGGIYNWETGIFEDIYGGGGGAGEPQHIEPLPGINYLWSSVGETEVNGSADINGVIEKLTNAIIALGGNI